LGDFLPLDAGMEIHGPVDKEVISFQFDSRKVSKGIAFVARKGVYQDGHKYIDSAIALGCELVVCEELPAILDPHVTYIKCRSVHDFLAKILPVFYDIDFKNIVIVGVTGTNGKTTVATLLYQLFSTLGYTCGLISTVEVRIGKDIFPSTHTTPDQISLFELMKEIQNKTCSHVFMEVSSHAIYQQRIHGLPFKVGIFTNITHDHLDYHKTFKNYLETKKRFFDQLDSGAIAITNVDDKNGNIMVQNTRASRWTYAMNQMADHRGRILENALSGLHLKFDNIEWHSKLIGEFNGYNLLAVYSCALALQMDKHEIIKALSSLNPPEGRFDWIQNKDNKKIGIVDYAHTPDALQKIIENIKIIKKEKQRIITVIGCGGDRDKDKRPVMAAVASELSDFVILTSDNPRSEKPEEILNQMENGINKNNKDAYLIIVDRTQAIKTACMISKEGDIILVAGKGHEKYQEIEGQKLPFDDMKILKQFLLN
jgi:UDP-N-acetylmuramoyl-L-alanyl-D-glutamate--2,6-diaminopimelate ligase